MSMSFLRWGHCMGSQRAERQDRIISPTLLSVPPSLQHSQPHLISTPGASQHTGPVTPVAAPTSSVYIWHRGTSAFPPTLTVTSRKQIQQCLYQASHNPLPSGERQTHRLKHAQTLFISMWPESQSHCPLPSLTNTLAFKLHVSCLAGVIFILLQDTLQVIERKWNTDLQLKFWLDRRFGSSERFSSLTWFQHLPGNRFSIHLYPLLWSTSTWAACSQVPAWIWPSGAAPAITAGIHPLKAKPATSCHCSKNQ